MNLGDYPKALEYYFRALKIDEEQGYKQYIANVTSNIGLIYDVQGDYQKALEFELKALKTIEELGDKTSIAISSANIARVYKKMKDYKTALYYCFKGLKLNEELGNKKPMADVNRLIGNIYTEQRNYIEALAYFENSAKISKETGNKRGLSWASMHIGDLFLTIIEDTLLKTGSNTGTKNVLDEPKSGSYNTKTAIPSGRAALLRAAFDHLNRGYVEAKDVSEPELTKEFYACYTKAYKLSSDYKQAMAYADSERILTDSFFSKETSKKIAALENKRRDFADSLKTADENRAREVKAAHRRNYELIGAGVLVLALGFIFLLRKNNKLLGKEKKRSDNLLLNILPEEVATQLNHTGSAAARNFDNVTVLFTDFVNFTEASGRMKPEALIEELDTCFKKFDAITGKYSIEKIKTIGDAYLAVCGLPHPDPNHAENVVRAAQEICAFMQDREAKLGNNTFQIRIGVHTGSVIAGIVGDKKFAYDIWGDTVNTAARMEQNSEAGKINISQTTYELVKDKITCEYRGEIDAKGKGMLKMYYIADRSFSEGAQN
jgi:class 3 adenylate cyclase